jgi:hypothetical protein
MEQSTMNISHSATIKTKKKRFRFFVGGWASLSSSRRRWSMKMIMTLMVVAMKFSPYS